MVTAAIAKASGARPTVVGKPSRAAVAEIRERLGVPTEDLLVIGDDVRMDIAPRPPRRLAHRARAQRHQRRHRLSTLPEQPPPARGRGRRRRAAHLALMRAALMQPI